jgi:predicted dehydrogenase
MLKLGIIGTNWISKSFLESALATGQYELVGIYSRTLASATAFNQGFNAKFLEWDFETFVARDMDVVYIASPNSVHYEQAKRLIMAGKHVIVEKPAVSNLRELQELLQLAKAHNCFFFEAARHLHEANFSLLQSQVAAIAPMIGGSLSYMKYSSRYPQVLSGEEPNIFSLKYSGGALMDLGVYLVYAAVALFGKPNDCQYYSQKIRTGVDGTGTIIFRYEGFDLTMITGKVSDSFAKAEFYGEKGTVVANSVALIDEIRLWQDGKFSDNLALPPSGTMIEEAAVFAEMILKPSENQEKYETLCQLALDVHELLTELRRKAKLVFDAD